MLKVSFSYDLFVVIAIRTSDIGEWRKFKIMRNQVSKVVEKSKQNYYLSKTNSVRNIWRNIKTLTGKQPLSTPKKIIQQGELLTSPSKIAETMNNYYIEKVDKIRI